MDEKQGRATFPREVSLVEKFRDKSYRDSYIASHTRRFLARQMRKFRGEKSQAEFGQIIDKRQTVVSRLEDPKYGKWTLQTLFEVASKLGVAVIVRFVDFPTFLKLTNDMSDEASRPAAYDQKMFEEFLPAAATLSPTLIGPTINLPNLPIDQSSLSGGTLGSYHLARESRPLDLFIVLHHGLSRHSQAPTVKPAEKDPIEELMNNLRKQNPIAEPMLFGAH